MAPVVELDHLSQEEKLRLLEDVWADLARTPESFASPEWHREVLEAREAELARGDDHLSDWSEAKERIRAARGV